MKSTPNLKATEPDDVLIERADERPRIQLNRLDAAEIAKIAVKQLGIQ